MTFGRKLLFSFAIPLFALVVIAFAGHATTTTLLANQEWVTHTYQVRSQIGHLERLMFEAETGQRGYLLTGDDTFLQPYEAAVKEIDRTYSSLRALTPDNPQQEQRLDALKPALDGRVAALRDIYLLRKNDGFDAAEKLVASGKGRDEMQKALTILAEMDQDEAQLLGQRTLASASGAANAKLIISWGSIAAVILVIVAGIAVTRSLTEQIATAVRSIQSSSTELQSAANQQASGAKEQSTTMAEINTTISELLATSRQIAESAQRVAQVTERTSATARTGDATVERGHEAIASIRRQVELIVQNMLDLGKKSQQIGSVLDILGELAEQTNILAINATIEAAGAGEAGKRFSVVADEIRKLADRVGGSTKEVRGLIDDVRSAVNLTVMTTETGSKAVEAGSKQFADVTASFKQIASQVGTANEAAKEIELSTKQQATAVEQVNVAVTNVAQGSKETAVSTAQTLQTAAQLSGLSRDLLRIVQPERPTPARLQAG